MSYSSLVLPAHPGQRRAQDTDLTWKPLIITLLFSSSLGVDFVTSGTLYRHEAQIF